MKSLKPVGLCSSDAAGLGPTAVLPGSGHSVLSYLNFRNSTLGPARTPDWLFFPSEFGEHTHILTLQQNLLES